MRSQRTDLLIIVIGRILQVAYGVAAMRGVTAVLSPDEIGRRDLVLSVTSWFALLLISPVGNYLNRQAVEWHLEGRLLESVRRFSMFLGGVALVGAASGPRQRLVAFILFILPATFAFLFVPALILILQNLSATRGD